MISYPFYRFIHYESTRFLTLGNIGLTRLLRVGYMYTSLDDLTQWKYTNIDDVNTYKYTCNAYLNVSNISEYALLCKFVKTNCKYIEKFYTKCCLH